MPAIITKRYRGSSRRGPPAFVLASHNVDQDVSDFSFASAGLGSGTSNDLWVIFLSANGASAARQVSACTIDGQGATFRQRFGSGDNSQNEVWTCAATANGSGTVEFSWTGSPSRGGYGLYRVTNGSYSASGGEGPATTLNAAPDMPVNSLLLAGVCVDNQTSISWMGLNEDFEGNLETADAHSTASMQFTAPSAAYAFSVSAPNEGAMTYAVVV